MQQVQTSWFMHKDQSPIAQDLSTELNISPIIAQLLVNRGIHDLAQARLFYTDPWMIYTLPMSLVGWRRQ